MHSHHQILFRSFSVFRIIFFSFTAQQKKRKQLNKRNNRTVDKWNNKNNQHRHDNFDVAKKVTKSICEPLRAHIYGT